MLSVSLYFKNFAKLQKNQVTAMNARQPIQFGSILNNHQHCQAEIRSGVIRFNSAMV